VKPMDFSQIFGRAGSLGQIGFYEFALPFLLVFSIIFAILDSIEMFKRRSEALVAVIIALFLTSNPAFMTWYSHFTAVMSMYFAVIAFAIILILLIGRPFLGDKPFHEAISKKMFLFGAIIIVGLLMFAAGGATPLPPGMGGLFGSMSRADFYTLLVLGGIFVLIIFTSSEKGTKETTKQSGP